VRSTRYRRYHFIRGLQQCSEQLPRTIEGKREHGPTARARVPVPHTVGYYHAVQWKGQPDLIGKKRQGISSLSFGFAQTPPLSTHPIPRRLPFRWILFLKRDMTSSFLSQCAGTKALIEGKLGA
jgi:hypothetical protein